MVGLDDRLRNIGGLMSASNLEKLLSQNLSNLRKDLDSNN
jgi:hypothetical protein